MVDIHHWPDLSLRLCHWGAFVDQGVRMVQIIGRVQGGFYLSIRWYQGVNPKIWQIAENCRHALIPVWTLSLHLVVISAQRILCKACTRPPCPPPPNLYFSVPLTDLEKLQERCSSLFLTLSFCLSRRHRHNAWMLGRWLTVNIPPCSLQWNWTEDMRDEGSIMRTVAHFSL